jgi:TonB-linked SusC/RagA family outer membrane protein
MKKNDLNFGNHEPDGFLSKLLRVMKLSVFLLLLSLSQVFAVESYSQRTKISLKLENVKIKDVFKSIENQSEFYFLYSPKIIDEQKKVNIKVRNRNITDVLNELFKGTDLDYLILDRQIVISDRSLLYSAKPQAEQKTITGKIVDDTGAPLPGVSVVIKGTMTGTITDFDGLYSLSVAVGDTIVYSFIGFRPKEMVVEANKDVYDLVLLPDVEKLEEVVVVGYGTQKKINVTGAVGAVKGEELAKKTMTDVRQALQGEISGVTIIDRGGIPGQENLSVNIRGVSSMSAGTAPYVLVDGIEMSMNDVNPNDIESISVLKDAASAAIYGAKAANGVILITTKRGKKGGFQVDYNGYYGIQSPADLPELVSAYDYLTLVNEAYVNAGLTPKYSDEYIKNTVEGVDPYKYPYTNLFEELFNNAGMWNHSLSLTGGNDVARTAISFSRLNQDGMLYEVNSKRTNFRMNNDFTLAEKFVLHTNVYYNRRDNTQPNRLGGALSAMVSTSPPTVLKYPNGTYGLNQNNYNALAALEVGGTNWEHNSTLNLQGGFDWNAFTGFNLKFNFSYKDINNRFKNYTAEYDFVDPNNPDNIVTSWQPSSLTNGKWSTQEINGRILGDYTKDIGNHHIYALGGMEIIDSRSEYIEGRRLNIYSPELTELNTGDIKGMENKGYSEGWGLWSYLGRANYSYADRYMFEVNFRYDGSSRFAEGHKWGFFPSFSAGWNIARENFMNGVDWLNNLKIRGSWGQLGNQDIGLYRFTSTVYTDYSYDFNDRLVNGYSQRYYANNDITWETSEMLDVGLDASFLNNKIDFTFDWYRKLTKDVLLTLPISYMVGLEPSEINAGRIRNVGWEANVTHKNTVGDLFYSIGFNISDVKNTLDDFSGREPSISGWTILKEGEPIYAFFGYENEGLFQSQEEIDNHAVQPNQQDLKPGDIKLKDQNGDGEINDDDRVVIGSDIPRYTVGLNLNMRFKGFDLVAVLQGVLKAQNYFYGELDEGPNFEVFTTPRALDRWTPENRDATYPRLEAFTNKNNYLYNDFWLRDSHYLRMKNLQIGYSMPEDLIKKILLRKLRLYIGVTNLFTITPVDPGIDPETYSGRWNSYPPVRTWSFGLQVGL